MTCANAGGSRRGNKKVLGEECQPNGTQQRVLGTRRQPAHRNKSKSKDENKSAGRSLWSSQTVTGMVTHASRTRKQDRIEKAHRHSESLGTPTAFGLDPALLYEICAKPAVLLYFGQT
jgi:hypothetical protein